MSEALKNPSQAPAKTLSEHGWSHCLSNRRQIGSVLAIVVALFLAWHVVTGRNGLTSWRQKRADDKALASEIDRLSTENAHLGQHVARLRSDPGAIEHEARARLRYARPGEVIWAEAQKSQGASSAH